LAAAAERLEQGAPLPEGLALALQHGASIGGARPKALMNSEVGRFIAKFSTSSHLYNLVKAEYLAMHLAARAGLDVADVRLTRSLNRDVLLVERFDRRAAASSRLCLSDHAADQGTVADLAGWRKARMPQIPEGHRFEVVPDWICEILSPSTESKDRHIKMPIYSHYGVRYAWLVDPKRQRLEAYALHGGEWRLLAEASGTDAIAVAPFDALTLELSNLWS
jgi:hypothetical protein